MALYFECRIDKNALPPDGFFGDFVHWVRVRYPCIPGSIRCLPFIVKTQKWCKYISQHLKRGDSDLSLKFTCFEIKGS